MVLVVLVFPFIFAISSKTLLSLGVVVVGRGHQGVSGFSLLLPQSKSPLPSAWCSEGLRHFNNLKVTISREKKETFETVETLPTSSNSPLLGNNSHSVSVVVFRQVVPLSLSLSLLAATSRATDFYSINAPAGPPACQRRDWFNHEQWIEYSVC